MLVSEIKIGGFNNPYPVDPNKKGGNYAVI